MNSSSNASPSAALRGANLDVEPSGRAAPRPGRSARERAARIQRLLAANPDYKFRETVRPSVWDETVLTERWEDRKARLAKERGASA